MITLSITNKDESEVMENNINKSALNLALIIIIILINSCAKKGSKYYRHIKVNGRYAIMGTYPVAEELGGKINCYHFIFDDKGKLDTIESLHNGKISARTIIEYTKGFEKRIFQDSKGRAKPNNGVYSIRLKLDEGDHPISLSNYNKEGDLGKDSSGIAQRLWTLDKKGGQIKVSYFDEKGNRVKEGNIYERRFRYDDNDNLIESASYSADGQQVDSEPGDIAVYRWQYDKKGNTVEERTYGKDDQLKEREDCGYAIVRYKYDENGYSTEQSYYGTDEQIKERKGWGIAIIRYNYDDRGNPIEKKFYGSDNQLKECVGLGIATIRWKYDNNGNLIEEEYSGTDGKLKEDEYKGIAITRYKYDEQGNLEEWKYMGIDEKLKEYHGKATFRFKYDGDGNIIKTTALDKNENVIYEK